MKIDKKQIDWAENNLNARKQIQKLRKTFDQSILVDYDQLLLRTRKLLAMYEMLEKQWSNN